MKVTNKFNKLLLIVVSCISIYLNIIYIKNNNLTRLLISLSIIPLMILPYLLNKFLKYKLTDSTITIYLLFIFASILLGSLFNFYDKIPIYDKIMHFTTGFLSSMLALIILINFNKYDDNNIRFNLIFMGAITCTTALLWEIFEYVSDFIFSGNAQRVLETGIHDTMQDMIAALLAFVIFGLLYWIEKRMNLKLIISNFIEEVCLNERKRTN